MIVTFFRGATDATPSPIDTTWPDFANLLRSWSEERAEVDCAPCAGKECAAKLAGMAFSPCRYADGATRGKASVLDVHAFAGDLDHLTRGQVATAREALDGTAHALYSTHNHLRGGEDDWCLRVVIPLSRPVPAADWRRFWLAFAEVSGLPLDKAVKSTASLLFMPSRPRGAAHVLEVAEGDPLDVDAVLEHAAPAESAPPPSPREDALRNLGGIAPTEIDADARKTLISLGKLARTLAPGGAYGRQGVGRRMTLYNAGRLIGGLAAAGRVHLDEALELVKRLCDPPLTPGGACEKALRDGALVGEEAPLTADPGPGIVAEARSLPAPEVRYPLEPWTWSQLEAVCRGAPDGAVPIRPRSREIRTTPEQDYGDVGWEDDTETVNNISRFHKRRMGRKEVIDNLRTDDKERVKPCGMNASLILRHAFWGQFRFNLLEKTVDASRSLFKHETPDTLPKAVADWIAAEHDFAVDFSSAQIAETLLLVGMENSYNPLREHLLGLAWDGVPRVRAGLGGWLETYARAVLTDDAGTDVSAYVREVGARWLVAAVARALHPGCKVDTVLVLEGKQGAGKSTLFKILGGDYYSETPLRIGDKDANIGAGSSWVIELAELASLKKTETEAQKQFLSTAVDTFRVPYGKANQRFPRSCVFGGTTNSERYLVDRTGNRRYWCVKTGDVDKTALRRDRDQLWAEAVHLLRNASSPDTDRGAEHEQGPGERWWFERHEQEAADEVNASRMDESVEDSVAELVRKWLDKPDGAGGPTKALLTDGVTTTDVCDKVLGVPAGQLNRGHLSVAGEALRKLGFVPKQLRRGGQRVRLYFKP